MAMWWKKLQRQNQWRHRQSRQRQRLLLSQPPRLNRSPRHRLSLHLSRNRRLSSRRLNQPPRRSQLLFQHRNQRLHPNQRPRQNGASPPV